jgi:NADP-dependent 3-hydroxy acid dehydrogenase YdfG
MAKGLVVITGASSGIGLACAQLFSKHGHPLLLLSRRLERMQALKLPQCICENVDVTDYAALEAAVRRAEDVYGRTACIINNAGVMLLGRIHTQDPAEWKTMLDTNVLGVLYGIRAVIDGMVAAQDGTVINISSIAGRKSFTDHAVYCGTKFAVHAITETAREEYAPHNVKFVIVSPGVVETELLDHTTDAQIVHGYKQWKQTIEPLQAVDVAEACWFAFNQPARCCVREIALNPTKQQP